MGKRLFWLSDKQWARIKRYLPTDVRGVERVATAASSAAVHVLKSGCRWRDCPEAARTRRFPISGERTIPPK
jgi:transposase